MTTTQTPAPLPFLLPAANLAVGDTLYSGAVIDARETAPDGKIHVTLMDGTVLEPMDPGELVEVRPRRLVQALRVMVAELTTLADEWDSPISTVTRPYRSFSQEDCAAMLRELLARLRA